MTTTLRLYINRALKSGYETELNEAQSHYLRNVMKLADGEGFLGFDGISGEYELTLRCLSKKHCVGIVGKQVRSMMTVPDIWLLFAPVKKDQTDYIVQKAVELGVSRLQPVITRRTNNERVRIDRLTAQSIEAAEQCRRLDIPLVSEAQPLEKLLQNWDTSRRLYFMDETRNGQPVAKVFAHAPTPAALLIGPEGGFAEEELHLLRSLDFAAGVTLGPRILRAETAAAAALSCWQALSGDWTDYTENK